MIIIATGSEVHPALLAGKQLKDKGISTRVVSLPSWELFNAQPAECRHGVLPPEIWRRITFEAGSSMGWERYAGPRGTVIGLDHFGASAPGNVVMEKLGFTAAHIVEEAEKLVGQSDG